MKSKVFHTFFTRLLTALVNFSIVILTTQFLGAEGRGIVSLIGASIAIILLFNDLIGGSSLVYLVPRKEPIQLVIPSYLWAILVNTIAYLAITFFKLIPHQDAATHTAILSLLFSIFSINLMVILGKDKIIIRNMLQLLNAVIILISLSVQFILIQHQAYTAYIQVLYISYSTCLILSFIFLLKLIPVKELHKSFDSLSSIIQLGFWAQSGNIVQFLSYRISYFLLSDMKGEASVGIFSVGVSLSEAIWMIGNSFAIVLYIATVNSKNPLLEKRKVLRYMKISFLLTFLAVSTLLLIPSSLLAFIFGSDFYEVKSVIYCLAPGILFLGTSTIISHYFSGLARYKTILLINSIGFVVAIIINLILIPSMDYLGSGIAASASYSILFIILITLFKQEHKLKLQELFPNRSFLKLCFRYLNKALLAKKRGSF